MQFHDAFCWALRREEPVLSSYRLPKSLVFTIVELRRIRNLGIMMPEVLLQPVWNAYVWNRSIGVPELRIYVQFSTAPCPSPDGFLLEMVEMEFVRRQC
jgi:hypothetical protein